MDFVHGTTLRDHLQARGGKLPLSEASVLLHDLVDGAQAMAARGVEHNDIWTQNIFVDQGHAHYVDFGASSIDGVRSPGKALPDAYTLGLVATQLITGHRVDEKFAEAGSMAKAPEHFFADPQIRESIPARSVTVKGHEVRLADVLRKAVDFHDHYASPAALLEALGPFLDR
jgi:serine/threonine protein kinase